LGKRSDRTAVTLVALLVGVSMAMLAVVYFMMNGSETPAVRTKDAHPFGTAAPSPQTPLLPQSPLAQAALPEGQAGGASDSLGFITNKEAFPQVAGNGPGRVVSASERARQKQFLGKYGGALKQSQAGINASIARHMQTSPVLRQIDDDLAHLDKFMAIKRRYQQDGDMYQWARDTAALPELRTVMHKYMAKPEAWSAGISLATDLIKTTPKPIYEEFIKMMVGDPSLRDFSNSVANDGAAYLPGAMTAAISQGIDVAPLQKAMTDLSLNK
jgi:hypothetical protein